MDKGMTQRESAIQYIVISLMNTPATNVESPSFGGGATQLVGRNRWAFDETRMRVAEVVHDANRSIVNHRPDFGDYSIRSIELKEVNEKTRGYDVVIEVRFANAVTENLTIPRS